LILYKESPLVSAGNASFHPEWRKRMKANHARHYASLTFIENVLKGAGLSFSKVRRGGAATFPKVDLIVTVGGDGTLLEAVRRAGPGQRIIGINSDPSWSVGRFCACDAPSFSPALSRLVPGKWRGTRLWRLCVRVSPGRKSFLVANDILICHRNPAAMSRYEIFCQGRAEEQRSSGLWFSTAAGSTGAVLSAGGRRMPLASPDVQFRARELYRASGSGSCLAGGIVPRDREVTVVSKMEQGTIFIDGAHLREPFPYGHKVRILPAASYVEILGVK